MTDIEKKALAYACECAGRTIYHYDKMGDDLALKASITAHARAIEAHEAFKREVSKAITDLTYIQHQYTFARGEVLGHLEKFVLKEPVDPLVEALSNWSGVSVAAVETEAFHACLAARGLEVRKIEGDA